MTAKRKKVNGKGINDMPIGFTKNKIYILWKGMLRRCYSSGHQRTHPSYIGASVCEEWLTLSNFVAWVESQDMEGKELDKDILCPGNKRYSPDTCLYVSHELNSLLGDAGPNRGDCPKGVYYCESQGGKKKYRAATTKYGKSCFIGYFDCVEEAHRAYCEAKSAHIREVAENLTDADTTDIERTREGLLKHAEIEGNRWRESEGDLRGI